MKPYILTIFFFCAIFRAQAQSPGSDEGERFIKKKCGVVLVHLPLKRSGQPYPLLFDSIRVIDFRRDTSRVGVIASGKWSQDQVLLRTPAAVQLGAYLKAGYTGPFGSNTLLVIIKDLWISGPGTYPGGVMHPVWNVAFRLEGYLQKGNEYTPLAYLDTLAAFSEYKVENMAASELPELTGLFMEKVADCFRDEDIAAKKTISYEQIDSFCRIPFSYSMDTTTSLTKGVYANVEEFRNNAPSILRYEVSKDPKSNLELQIPDENGQLYFTHTVWGFCDGKQVYVMMDGNVFPVFCVHHQFYVLGSKEYRNPKVNVPMFIPLGIGYSVFLGGVNSIADNVSRALRLFRLDVQSGEVTE
jgi:hypothetical protein